MSVTTPLVMGTATVARLEARTSFPESQLTAFESRMGKLDWKGRFESSSAKVRTARPQRGLGDQNEGSSSLPATTRYAPRRDQSRLLHHDVVESHVLHQRMLAFRS